MYAGRKVEEAPVEEIFARPLHPYTRGLLGCGAEARFLADRWRARQAGGDSRPGAEPAAAIVGCPFAGRCPMATELCRASRRRSRPRRPTTWSACHYAETPDGRHDRRTPVARGQRPQEALPDPRRLARPETAKVYAVDGVTFSTSTAARRCRWWANRAAASPPSARRSCGCIRSPTARSVLDGERIDNLPAGTAAAAAAARAGGVPGPVLLAQSAHAGARHPGRAADQFRHRARQPRADRAGRSS